MKLEVQKLSKSYGSQVVINNIDLTLGSGMNCGLIGGNGAGKTTFLNCLLGTIPCQGSIFMNGILNNEYLVRHPAEVSYVPAEVDVYSYLNGYEFLQLCVELKGLNYKDLKSTVDECVENFALTEDMLRLVGGYSLGMKRKLAVMAAFLGKPSLIILDEPFNGLDTLSTIYLKKMISQTKSEGSLIIITSHLLDAIANQADRVLILHNHQIAADFHLGADVDRNVRELERKYLTIISDGQTGD